MAVANQFVAPQNETEGKLADIWAAVLGVEKVGVRDNFFELGGDSILAIQIVARAQRAGIKITTRLFFETLTVEKLASGCTEASQQRRASESQPSNLTSESKSDFSMVGLSEDALKNLAGILEKKKGG